MPRTCPDCQTTYSSGVQHCPQDGHELSEAPAPDELIGRRIGSYKVTRLLGKGGMGAVYEGVHPAIGSKVAIKFLHPQYATDQKIVDRFFNEARAVNVIGHDNILKIIDLDVTDDHRHYFVMEFLQGRPLQALLDGGAVPLEVAGPILLQICEALEAAHRKGIIHRDLKPDNVYLIALKGKKNFVKVVDFGIARVTDENGESSGNTRTGAVMGTPAYMSPEQGGGATALIDARSDVYSLGVMMFQLATGELPFPGTTFGEILIGHLQKPPPEPRSINPAIPESYERLILRCLEKDQAKRPQSMHELYEALGACLDELGLSRELPAAEAGDPEVTLVEGRPASHPSGPRTPGRTTGHGARASNPGVRASNPGARASNPGARASNPAARSSNPDARASSPAVRASNPNASAQRTPARSRLALYLGIAAAAVVVAGGGVAFVLKQSAERDALVAARAARETADRLRAAQASMAEAEPAKPAAPIFLSVVSDPLEAEVSASWPGGEQKGPAPLALQVPPNSKVHLSFVKPGFAAQEMELIADANRTVTATLVAVASPQRPSRHRPRPGAPQKSSNPDALIDLNDALK